jgi:mannosylglycerate hydrolase
MRNIHIVSHTHWDREWYRPFQLFRLKLVHLIDGVLDLLDHNPQFKYFMLDGQTIVLDDYLAMRPEMEEKLRRYIQKGRLIIGPWHILPDMFLVGPESHIRNLLQGDRTASGFGRKMRIGYLPDPFGHPGQVPQILQGFGIDTACLWRGLDDEPAEFWWESPDGSRVLMVYMRDSYSNGAGLPANNLPDFANAVAYEADLLGEHSVAMDYLIMFGTDHMEPPPNTSNAIAYANKNLPDTRVIHSTLPDFVVALRAFLGKNKAALPVVTGELRACRRSHLLPGVLSSRMWIKQRNHAAENLLLKWVEPFSTFAALAEPERKFPTAIDHPARLIHNTWRLLMENHPHDSICGCSIDQVHEEMKVRFDQVDQVGEELALQSLEILAASICTASEHGRSAVVVFNPSSSPRTDVITTKLELPADVNEFDLADEAGNLIPYQTRGLGSREVINMTMDVKEFRTAFGWISDGRAAGMTIQGLKMRREDNHVYIEAVVADGGEPDKTVWKAGRRLADEYLDDPSITIYHVHALSASAAQVTLVIRDIPSCGYKTLWIRPRPGNGMADKELSPVIKALLPLANLPIIRKLLAPRQKSTRPPYIIENDYFKVRVAGNGSCTLTDKRNGRIYYGINTFQDGGDCGDEYNYAPPPRDRILTPRLKHVTRSSGLVQQSLVLELELSVPAGLSQDRQSRSKKKVRIPIRTCISLAKGVPRLDIHTTINNTALDHRLRVHFPTPFSVDRGFQDGHFELVERKLDLPVPDDTWIEQPRPEVPQRAFTDITDGQFGLMVANRGLPEVEVLRGPAGGTEIAVTLLRCIGWLSRDDFTTRKGHAGPFMETPGAQMLGTWSFDYSVIPHEGDWKIACDQAYAFETPLKVIGTGLHDGKLPPVLSFVSVNPSSFKISAIKECENTRGWLVRGYNLTGESIEVTLQPWKSFRKVELVNLAEQRLASLKSGKDGSVVFNARGHEIVSIMFKE